ncbi:BppU family phage baseplate upper protein [Clostridium algoriphilum]|uniref:BppU family phage baseplate upper protein n=1 Tax=Clostridium algoriphilum TaxID=198347 RepID=UPI001CF230D5|nr:BppU family phage baseplate upper protein [Clostridium algoriphilum]MCB2292495.1 BppU family phage baseplate upper protein [Clostridium algoriphilum]
MFRNIDHIINIDLANRINVNNNINIEKNDINSHRFLITLYYNSIDYNLTGSTARIYFKKPDTTKILENCLIYNALCGNISYLLEPQVVSCVGIVATEIIIYDDNGRIITSVSFNFTVIENNTHEIFDADIDKAKQNEIDYGIKKIREYDLIVNVLDFGAKGDGITNDTLAIQECINKASSTGVIFFPSTGSFYKVTSLTIPSGKANLKLLGTGMVHSFIKFSSKKAISVQCDGVHFDSLRLQGAGIQVANTFLFKDERPSNMADFDITIRNCYISEVETVVETRGRGVIIEFSAFYAIRYQIIKADFPMLKVFVSSVENTQTYKSGFRGFIFRENRVHYSPCTILNNVGSNKMNLSGVLITGNQLEGSTTYIDGYVRNCIVSNNIHYHVGNVREALIILHGCDNVNIELNVSGKKICNEGIDSYSNKIVHCTGKYNNLTIKANIQDVYKDVFYFNAGGDNLDIHVNASNICRADTKCYSLLRLDNKRAVYDGVNVRGIINSPASNFTAIKRSGNIVKNHNINLDIIGDFLSYNNLDSCVPSTRKTTNGLYTGDGTTNRQITIKYKPALVQVFSNNFLGVKHIENATLAPNITINNSGFTVKLTANVINETYVYIVQ